MYRVYVFLDQFGKPYYVGKTNDFYRRRGEHLHEIQKGNNLPKYQKAREIIKKGYRFRMKTIVKVDTEEKAFKLEREYILRYRKKYKLTNMTYGGPNELPIYPRKRSESKKVKGQGPAVNKKRTKNSHIKPIKLGKHAKKLKKVKNKSLTRRK